MTELSTRGWVWGLALQDAGSNEWTTRERVEDLLDSVGQTAHRNTILNVLHEIEEHGFLEHERGNTRWYAAEKLNGAEP